MDIIALIFDFDDTLVSDSTTQLLNHYGIDTKKFWGEDFVALVKSGYNPVNAYLRLILKEVKDGKLHGLKNEDLKNFGRDVISKSHYGGIQGLLKDLKKIVGEIGNGNIEIEFFIISSGLEDIIKGDIFFNTNFNEIYGCCLCGENNNDELKYIKHLITFTEKTRYLFQINKGISRQDSIEDPYAVNKDVELTKRRVPFENMIYVGDGLTDIPCFSLIKKNGGTPLGILHTDKTMSEKSKVIKHILKSGRTYGAYLPEYGKNTSLGEMIRTLVELKTADIYVKNKIT